jgi:hypothetical protein
MSINNSSITIRSIQKWTGYLLLLMLPGTLLLVPLAAWWLHRRGGTRGANASTANLCDRTPGSEIGEPIKAAAPHVLPIRRKQHVGLRDFNSGAG